MACSLRLFKSLLYVQSRGYFSDFSNHIFKGKISACHPKALLKKKKGVQRSQEDSRLSTRYPFIWCLAADSHRAGIRRAGGLPVECRASPCSTATPQHPPPAPTPVPHHGALGGGERCVPHGVPPLHVERISPGRRLALFPVFVKICTKPLRGMEPTL